MAKTENRPQRLTRKPSAKKQLKPVVLHATAKKPLGERVSSGNSSTATRAAPSSPVTTLRFLPRRTRPSILPEGHRDALTPHDIKDSSDATSGSALSSMGSRVPGAVKSVRWDPSIISFDLATSEKRSSTEKIVESLRAITESVSMIQKQADDLADHVNTAARFKKPAHQRLQKLLDELKEIDTQVGPSSQWAHEIPSNESKEISEATDSKPLNPCAPVFRNTTESRSQIPNQKFDPPRDLSALKFPSRRPRISLDDRYYGVQSPTWSMTSMPRAIPTPLTQRFFITPSSTLVPNATNPQLRASPPGDVNWCEIPCDEEHGRVAQAINPDWAKSIMEKFVVKYPLTGKLKAAPTATAQGRHATVIQQKLEFLLMKEREKKAVAKAGEM